MRKNHVVISAIILLVFGGLKAHCQVQSFENAEKEFYQKVIKKLEENSKEDLIKYEALSFIRNTVSELLEANKKTLEQFDKENEKSFVDSRVTRIEREKAKKYSKQNRDLFGRQGYVRVDKSKYLAKNEFETYQQFSDRAKQFVDKRRALSKKNRDSIKKLTKSIESPWTRNLAKSFRSAKNKYEDKKDLLSFAKRSRLKILKSNECNINHLTYDAEKQTFKISLKVEGKYGERTKNYTIKVPLSEAESFKKNIELSSFAFMLGDLRGIITNGKIIKIEPNSTWYSDL